MSSPNPSSNAPQRPERPGRDLAGETLLNRYSVTRDRNLAAAGYGPLSEDVREQLRDLVRDCEAVTMRGQHLLGLLPVGRYIETWNPDTKVTTYQRIPERRTPYIDNGLLVAQQIASKLDDADQRAESIVRAAYLTVGPDLPQNAQPHEIADRKADIIAILQATQEGQRTSVAQALVLDALKDSDRLTIACVMGEPCRLMLPAMGVDMLLIAKSYVQTVIAQSPTGAYANSMGQEPVRGARFFALQDGQWALANMAPAALQYYTHQLSAVKAALQ